MARLLSLVLLLLAGCTFRQYPPPDLKPTVILISFDGFRWDYLDKTDTPNLHALAASGVRAKSLIPIFPSMTFPNHYSIVTGLYAEHHGIVNNDMYDPRNGKRFAIRDDAATGAGEWWGGEPIWVTAEKQGQHAASMYWIGSSAEIAGKRPDFWFPFSKWTMRSEKVRTVLDWLDLPGDRRPTFITMYFPEPDSSGHSYGPDSDEVKKAVRDADGAMGELVAGLRARKLDDKVNLIVVSDHGMALIPPEQAIPLEKFLPPGKAEVAGSGSIVGLFPKPGVDPGELVKAFANVPHVHAFRREELPPRFHYRDHPRIAPVQLLTDLGWYLTRGGKKPTTGAHGYDPELPEMQALFVAHGPAFRAGLVLPSFENVHLYELMAHLLSLKPAPNDGNFEAVKGMLNGNGR